MSKEVKTAVIAGIFAVIAAICAAIIGVFFNANKDPNANFSSPSAVSIVIHDQLGPEQISETVDIIIDGKKRGSIVIDQYKPEDFMTITISPGSHSYTLNSVAIFSDQNTYSSSGRGIIDVAEGKQYELQTINDGTLTLIERP